MRCTSCYSDNLEHRRYCAQCGSELPTACLECGFGNEPQASYCGGCGRSLMADQQPTGAQPDGTRLPERRFPAFAEVRAEPERRPLTVMFCDMVASSGLAERLDPEDLREVMHSFQQAIASVVFRYEGFIAKYMGDGVLIYYGYPTAHEDDAERALRAGLDIVREVPAIDLPALDTDDRRLAVRITIPRPA